MEKTCIACGKELKKVVCKGKINDMSVSFCDEHASYCENCDTIVCKGLKKKD
ncbi:hypothetical protein ACFLQN_04000 [Candidatus Aenigmatarchaeota archaeon]